MTHLRKRYSLALVKERMAYSPIVAIQGPRQCGKSFLAKKLLAGSRSRAVYQTFDSANERSFAAKNPDSYLAQYSDADPLIIDEAQKVPDIFDALKLAVDERRRPGQFVILGSTEFSRLAMIRESLTGRLSRIRLYPFTLAESRHQPFNLMNTKSGINEENEIPRSDLLRYLERGGFPGIFTTNNKSYRNSLLKDWIDLTVERDIHTFPRTKADSSLARAIIEGIARLEHPDLSNIAKYTGRNARTVQRHLEILETLFVIVKIPPHPLGTGKPIYFLCDVGLLGIYGAELDKSLRTFAINELLAKNSYANTNRQYYYYRNTKGSVIDLVEADGKDLTAIKILPQESFDSRQFAILKAFQDKAPHARLLCLGSKPQELKLEGIKIVRWEAVG
jgi:predicted AAA+ superfamily ATPase